MLPVSSISDAANKLRHLLFSQIDEIENVTHIKIGHPNDTFEKLKDDINYLNLFIYNVKYDGYPADGYSDDPFFVRIHCLITAIGSKKNSSTISSGENDLRLIGEVMRILHQQPVISINTTNNIEVASLQIVPHALDLDSLNHIWSTQGETAYRLSVAYELSLAPIPLASARHTSPLTSEMLWGARGQKINWPTNDQVVLGSYKPLVEYLEINTEKDDWTPHICFVKRVDESTQELNYVFKVEDELNTELDILVAGKNNGVVKFIWNVWRRNTNNTVIAWTEGIEDTLIPQEKEIKDTADPGDHFLPHIIDPDNVDTRRIFKAKLPDDVRLDDTKSWQAVLFAVNEWTRESLADGGGLITTAIKSNPLLFYGENE